MAENVLNWNESSLCQTTKNYPLQKPQNNPRVVDNGEAAYRSLADILFNLRDGDSNCDFPDYITEDALFLRH